jgi:death on curing protein
MRVADVLYLELEHVLLAHKVSLQEFGGGDGLRDQGLLESAIAAPQHGYYKTLAELAAAYAVGLAMNHPFVDGNKRTALASAGMFLNAHGFDLVLGLEWIQHMEQLAAGMLSRQVLVEKFTAAMGGDPVKLEI